MTDLHGNTNPLGAYLKDRRAKLDPAVFGFPPERRRTVGLRREEVAQRANISPTWYTWLEQGRGGAPSADVLNRISRALMLTEFEREHLFLLGLGRPPEVRYCKDEGVTPRLQRVLDALEPSPVGRRRLEPGVDGHDDRLRIAAARATQCPAPDVPRSRRSRRAV